MCGIFAYLNYGVERNRSDILEILFNGLRRLEYRGYDSAGVSVDADWESSMRNTSTEISPPLVFRQEGKIDALTNRVYEDVKKNQIRLDTVFKTHLGIAHTRWATHGQPSERNSHPQSSGRENDFLVVHNGIITNFQILKETLVKHGFEFDSDTDTEVIPKLAKYVFDNLKEERREINSRGNGNGSISTRVSFKDVVVEVIRQLEGAFALIFKSPHFPDELIACKRGSPLLLGVKNLSAIGDEEEEEARFAELELPNSFKEGPKEYFLASDASAVVEHTKKVIIMEDNEVVHIHNGKVSLFSFKKSKSIAGSKQASAIHRALSTLQMEVEQIKKGNYQHFMQKEIHEQPESLTTTMRGRVIRSSPGKTKGVLLGGLKDFLPSIRHSRRVIFIGCGTSFHAALASRPLLEELSGLPVQMEVASDLLDRQAPIYREDTCVFLSQSGETADTLSALHYAKARGALCVGVTNTVGSSLARGTDCGVHLNAGCEIGVASTKAYTSQIAVLTMMALALGEDSLSTKERREAIIDGLLGLPDKVRQVLELDLVMRSLASELLREQSVLVFGRGFNYATALEGALKVKEVALTHSEGLLAGEVKHGPLALVDETLPVFVIATRDRTWSKQQSVIQQLQARKGRLIVLCSEGDSTEVCPNGGARVIEVPLVADCLQPIINVIPFQLLAYHLTVLRGFNVDQPRNLAKSVTTE